MANENKEEVEKKTEIPFGGGAFDMQSATIQALTAGRPEGGAARGYTEKVKKSIDDADKEIVKMLGSDKDAIARFKERSAIQNHEKLQNAWQYESAQLIHHAKEQMESEVALSINSLSELLDEAAIASHVTSAAMLEQATDALKANIDNQNANNERISPEEREQIAESNAETTKRIHEEHNKAVLNIKEYYDAYGKFSFERFNAQMQLTHSRAIELAKARFGNNQTAVAWANNAVRENTKKMVRACVARSPYYAKMLIEWLDRDIKHAADHAEDVEGKTAMEEFEDNGNITVNPIERWCLTKGDIAELRHAYNTYEEQDKQNRRKAQLEAKQEMNNSAEAVKNEIYWLANGYTHVDGKAVHIDAIKDVKKRKDTYDAAEKTIAKAINDLESKGYNKSGALYAMLVNEPRKTLARKERFDKAVEDANAQSDIDEQLTKLRESPDGKFKIKATIINETTGKPEEKEFDCDADKCIIDLITSARARGLCKGQPYDDILASANNSNRTFNILQNAIGKVFKFPTNKTVMYNGEWKDRDGGTDFVILKKDAYNKASLGNVHSNMRVKLHDDQWGPDGGDRWLNADVANQVVQMAFDALNDMMNPTQEDIDTALKTALDECLKTRDAKVFQRDYLREVSKALNTPFQSSNVNVLTLTFSDGSTASEIENPSGMGKTRFSEIRAWHPIYNKSRQLAIKNAIISASEEDSADESELDAMFGSESTEEQ